MMTRDLQSDVLAFDVGGANIKAADGLGWTHTEPFALWQRPAALTATLGRIVAERRPSRVVATMTGEIADCFTSREAGVAHIVRALEEAADSGPRHAALGIYLVDGTFTSPAAARTTPLSAAAANWHAMARLAAAAAPTDRTFVIDIGSTTTDIVPIVSGVPTPVGLDDVTRMATGALVYTGVERTPVAAIVRSLPWPSAGAARRPVASERYADSRDAWLLLGGIPEDRESRETADGQPSTRDAAAIRLARMLLADPDRFSPDDAVAAAAWCARAQARQVARGLARVGEAVGWRPSGIVLSGHGACLAEAALECLGWRCDVVSLSARLGPAIARAACAHAVALIDRGVLR